jgi:hypothetical protein
VAYPPVGTSWESIDSEMLFAVNVDLSLVLWETDIQRFEGGYPLSAVATEAFGVWIA